LFTTASTTKGKMSRQLKGFEAKRVVGKGKNQRQIKVQLLVTTVGDKQSVPMVHEPYNITKIKKPTKIYGNYLPSDFEVSGLPCKIVFRLDKVKTFADSYSMQITHITFDCPNGLQSSDIPIDLIRTLAVKASAFVAEVTPANTRIDHSPGNYTVTGCFRPRRGKARNRKSVCRHKADRRGSLQANWLPLQHFASRLKAQTNYAGVWALVGLGA